ncbi:hypothetical protein ACLOJK_001430 [Asimina triloba]
MAILAGEKVMAVMAAAGVMLVAFHFTGVAAQIPTAIVVGAGMSGDSFVVSIYPFLYMFVQDLTEDHDILVAIRAGAAAINPTFGV